MPKAASPAVYLDLLDATGVPTWAAHDVQQHVQLAKSRQEDATDRQADQQQLLQRQLSRGWSDSSAKSWDAAPSRDQGGGWQQWNTMDDDFDEDILLAKAAAEVGPCGIDGLMDPSSTWYQVHARPSTVARRVTVELQEIHHSNSCYWSFL